MDSGRAYKVVWPDVFLGAHAEYFDDEQKRERAKTIGAEAWVNPDQYRQFVEAEAGPRRSSGFRTEREEVVAKTETPVFCLRGIQQPRWRHHRVAARAARGLGRDYGRSMRNEMAKPMWVLGSRNVRVPKSAASTPKVRVKL